MSGQGQSIQYQLFLSADSLNNESLQRTPVNYRVKLQKNEYTRGNTPREVYFTDKKQNSVQTWWLMAIKTQIERWVIGAMIGGRRGSLSLAQGETRISNWQEHWQRSTDTDSMDSPTHNHTGGLNFNMPNQPNFGSLWLHPLHLLDPPTPLPVTWSRIDAQ